MGLKNGDLISFDGEEVRAGEAGRAAPYHCYFLSVSRGNGGLSEFIVFKVGEVSLHKVYGSGCIYIIPSAVGLAVFHTDPSADNGHGVRLPDQLEGLMVFAHVSQGKVSLDVYVRRAIGMARTAAVCVMV